MDVAWGEIWVLLYAGIILSTIGLILLENRNPLKALSWVIVLLLVPLAGLIFYFIFGKDTRRVRLISRQSYKRIMEEATPKVPFSQASSYLTEQETKYDRLMALIERQTDNTVLLAQEIEIFTNGKSKFERLLEDIKRAKHHIHMEYYIFRNDSTGQRVADALTLKAKEGVTVRLLYDYVGSAWGQRQFFRRMSDAGVLLYPFLPVVFPLFTSKENYRNHRKVVVIDGSIGYVGGMNISNNYTIGNALGLWRDTHFRMVGVAVNGLQAAFITDWYVASKVILPSSMYYGRQVLPEATTSSAMTPDISVQTFTSGPTGQFRTLQQALCHAIYGAKKSIKIQTPYFLPTDSLNRAIIGAALSGVQVDMLVPYESDSVWTKYASRSYYEELMKAGVNIYVYKGGFLHSKLITVDSDLAILGSANLDFRSMEHNFEISSIVYDEAFTRRLEAMMTNDLTSNGILLNRSEWKRRPLLQKFRESILRLFAPLL